jgi:hypothetical protein
MKACRTLFVLGAMSAVAVSSAQLQVNGAETGGLNTAIRSAGRTYLAAYENETLSGVSGAAQIIGVRFRGINNANFLSPALTASTINFSNFEIVMGLPSNALVSAGEFSTTANTFGSWSTGLSTVRTGAFTMGANFWQVGQWTPTILFDTPFAYDASNDSGLLFGFSHLGSDTLLDSTNFPAASRAFLNWGSGLGADAIFATNGSGFASTPSGFLDPLIVEFVVVPEPASMIALGFGALALLKRRKKN